MSSEIILAQYTGVIISFFEKVVGLVLISWTTIKKPNEMSLVKGSSESAFLENSERQKKRGEGALNRIVFVCACMHIFCSFGNRSIYTVYLAI
jgi:hypothetical protein